MVLDIAFWLLFLITPAAMFFLLKLAGEKVNQISLVNIVSVSLYVFGVIGTLPLFFHLDEYRVEMGITDQSVILEVLFFSCVTIVFFLIGVVFVRRVMLLKPIPIISSEIIGLNKSRYLALILLFIFFSVVLYIYLAQIDQIAFFVALKKGVVAAALARSDMGNNFLGKYYRYSLVLHDIGTIVTVSFYISWLLNKKATFFLMFITSFSLSAFVAVMATEKAPFIELLVALFIAHYIVRHNCYVPKKDILISGGVALSFLIVFYVFFMGSDSIAKAFSSIISRAFSGSIAPAYFYLEYFPAQQPFMLGKSFPNPAGIMPYVPIRYTVDVMNFVFPNLSRSGVVGSMPTIFWGESYANFGALSIPVVAFLMGGGTAVLSFVVSKIETNPLTIAFFVWLIFHMKKISVTGFSGYIFDTGLIFVFILIISVLFVSFKIKIRKSTDFF